MATVADLTAPYGNVLIAPQPGAGVCATCFNLTDGYDRCYACTRTGDHLDVVAPISYSVAGGQLHHALAAYKRTAEPWTTALVHGLAAVLWRHLATHERCLRAAAGLDPDDPFELVTTVPSTQVHREVPHPLQAMVSRLVGPTRERATALLRHAPSDIRGRQPDFTATRQLDGEAVLLIDDTWTTGASAQGAAAALKRAGAGPVVGLVIGRHMNRDWHDNDRRLRALPTPFDWDRCPFCTDRVTERAPVGTTEPAVGVTGAPAHQGGGEPGSCAVSVRSSPSSPPPRWSRPAGARAAAER